jgi:hypothetical protein
MTASHSEIESADCRLFYYHLRAFAGPWGGRSTVVFRPVDDSVGFVLADQRRKVLAALLREKA